ncbi:hypothetical protein [Pseudomonas sp. AB12(2023)]|uniref:hypothetical protein n=1 Tax=Pseudomonas sp. AB12(2023) TaxID=3048597 RepID=UPI002B23B4FD|nr:hypothetical protein [Pseudomonas sp. AB12(2023)]MEB0222085.1 hypothetical protein [Pseudomonas sp. AB12(2023)]
MPISINEALPVLDKILEQQVAISDRLQKLIETFKKEPEPIEPTLRSLLKPLNDGMETLEESMIHQKS